MCLIFVLNIFAKLLEVFQFHINRSLLYSSFSTWNYDSYGISSSLGQDRTQTSIRASNKIQLSPMQLMWLPIVRLTIWWWRLLVGLNERLKQALCYQGLIWSPWYKNYPLTITRTWIMNFDFCTWNLIRQYHAQIHTQKDVDN